MRLWDPFGDAKIAGWPSGLNEHDSLNLESLSFTEEQALAYLERLEADDFVRAIHLEYREAKVVYMATLHRRLDPDKLWHRPSLTYPAKLSSRFRIIDAMDAALQGVPNNPIRGLLDDLKVIEVAIENGELAAFTDPDEELRQGPADEPVPVDEPIWKYWVTLDDFREFMVAKGLRAAKKRQAWRPTALKILLEVAACEIFIPVSEGGRLDPQYPPVKADVARELRKRGMEPTPAEHAASLLVPDQRKKGGRLPKRGGLKIRPLSLRPTP